MPTSPRRSRSVRTLILLLLSLMLAFPITAGVLYGIHVYQDSSLLAHADPTMLALASEAGMSREGELVFLRTHPELVSDTQMQQMCSANTAANNSDGFIEQGCYVTGTHRIYLRRMPANLYQLEISTAAYEMLHPVYLSLTNTSYRAKSIDNVIEANYNALKDTNLIAQVANFAKTEPGARDLELFSLLGTGYANISPALKQYYIPYFTNLNAAITASNQIKQRFLQNEEQLAELKTQIDTYDGEAKRAYATSAQRARAGDQTGDDYYYRLYRQEIAKENGLIAQYNNLLLSYNALVTEYNGTQPVQSIDLAQTQ